MDLTRPAVLAQVDGRPELIAHARKRRKRRPSFVPGFIVGALRGRLIMFDHTYSSADPTKDSFSTHGASGRWSPLTLVSRLSLISRAPP